MKKLVVSDLDGTLLNDEGKVTKKTIETIKNLKKFDIEFTIATGRGLKSTKNIKDTIGIDCFMICNNGANIYDKNENLIAENFIPKELAKKTIDFLNLHSISYKAFCGKKFFFSENTIINEHIAKEYELCELKNSSDIIQLEKILIIEDDRIKFQNYRNLIAEKFSKELEVVVSSENCLDLNIKNCSKKLGVEIVSKNLNVEKENIFAFGDSENDYKMLQFVGNPIPMKESFLAKKYNFSQNTDFRNDEDGVAKYLEKLFFRDNL